MNFPTIYLASRSPRRRELLQQIGVDFSVIDVSVDEAPADNELPADYVLRIAKEKALTGKSMLNQQKNPRPVLAADTAVVIEQQILGKPINDGHAREMLNQLSGITHQVMTAVAFVANNGDMFTRLCISEVTFSSLSGSEIETYIKTGEGQDKAGSYAVQGLAALFIERIYGSYSGIMGLPVYETGQLLTELGSHEQ